MYIAIIILAFALSFHFLLMNQPSFQNMWYSLIKTLVWMLGDLGYDDTFINDDAVKYPILANLLFVLFVTAIGWLVFNVSLTNQSDQLDSIRESATFHQADSVLKLHLFIDDCVPSCRRKNALNKNTLFLKNNKWHSKTISESYSSVQTNETEVSKNELGDRKTDEDSDKDLSNDIILINHKMDAITEQLTDLSLQIKLVTKEPSSK